MKKIFIVIIFALNSINLTNTVVYGMKEKLEQSLFSSIPWLEQKIEAQVEHKRFYLFNNMVADTKHIIVSKVLKSRTYTDRNNRVMIFVPIKPQGEVSYKNCKREEGGYISFVATFVKSQVDKLDEEDLSPSGNGIIGGIATFFRNQKTIDEQIDAILVKPENEEYRWIDAEENSRELVSFFGGEGSGYVFTDECGKRQVFLSLVDYVDLNVKRYTFTSLEEIQKRVDHLGRKKPITDFLWKVE